ncbi:MAG: DnaJ family domain-containing protein [Chloroflexota bacterium]
MEDIVANIADKKIREAQERGEFTNLPGEGRPLDLADLSLIPEELRVAFLALKNAGFLPEEAQLRIEIAQLEGAIAQETDVVARGRLRAELQDKNLRYAYLTERWTAKRSPQRRRLRRP